MALKVSIKSPFGSLSADELQVLAASHSDAAIARQFGVHAVTVAAKRKHHGIDNGYRQNWRIAIDAKRVRELYSRGWGVKSIAKELGCSKTAVRRRLVDTQVALGGVEDAYARMMMAHDRRRKTKRESAGYRWLYLPQHPAANNHGCIAEHRYLVESAIGRYLTDDEIVHHLNMGKTDNRVENLALLTKADHLRVHKYMERVCAYLCLGAARPATLMFGAPVFWAGKWIESLELISDRIETAA